MLRMLLASLALMVGVSMASALGDARVESREPAASRDPSEVQVAATRTYRLFNALPFIVEVKIHGNGPSFPQVRKVPPGGVVAIPYPDLSMRLQMRSLSSPWSPMLTVPWRSSKITLPNF